MSLKLLPLQNGATFSFTGGTPDSLLDMGSDFTEARFIVDGGTSIADQVNLTFRHSPPTPNVRGAAGYTQSRRIAQIAVPEVINGETVYHSVEIKVSSDRRAQDTVVAKLLQYAASLVVDPNTSNFWEDGSTA